MDAMKKLVTIYVRKSRLKNDDEMEIERQIQLLVEYAERNNMEYKIFDEQGDSESWNREKLQQMLSELELGIYDGVLVTEQDRLSRDSTDFGLFKRLCVQQSLLLYTLERTYDFTNDEDNFMTGIQAEMDSHFMRITKRKLLRGRIQALENGVYFGVAPFGYTKAQGRIKHLVPIKEEAEVVKMIFESYLYGQASHRDIAEKVNLLGFKTRENKRFVSSSIKNILSNSAYHGELRYDLKVRPIINESAHEAIIDKKMFNNVQLALKERSQVRQKSTKGKYLLARLIECANCGTSLTFCMKYVGNKKKDLSRRERELYLLNCRSSLGIPSKHMTGEKCLNIGTKSWRVEEAVLKEIEKHLPEIDKEIDVLLTEGSELLKRVKPKIEQVERQLSQFQNRRKVIQEGYEFGIYSPEETAEKLKNLDDEKLRLENERERLSEMDVSSEVKEREVIKEKIIKILSMSKEGQKAEANVLLRSVIERIYYYKEERDQHVLKPFQLHVVYK